MNDFLTRKKHSKMIAKLALELNIIDKELFNDLYITCSGIQRRIKNGKYRVYVLYEEFHYCKGPDYWGEYDEISIIDHVRDILFYRLNKLDENCEPIDPIFKLKTTLDIIKCLNKLKKTGWKYNRSRR